MLLLVGIIVVSMLVGYAFGPRYDKGDYTFLGFFIGVLLWLVIGISLTGLDIVENVVEFTDFEILAVAGNQATVEYDGRRSIMTIALTDEESHVERIDGVSNWITINDNGRELLRLNVEDAE